MKARESIRFVIQFVGVALAVGLIARYVATTFGYDMTQAQSPQPTWTFTPAPSDTPTPTPTPTNTPTPTPTPTNTPVPLACSDATASVATLWPPDHRFVAITILGVRGLQEDTIGITIDSILQDEPVHIAGSGSTSPDGRGVGGAVSEVRAERAGEGNGRVYHIGFTADGESGGTCSGEVLVGVPHSENYAAVDDGRLYDSTVAIP